MSDKIFLTKKACAARLGVSTKTVERWERQGEFQRAGRPGALWRVNLGEWLQFEDRFRRGLAPRKARLESAAAE